MLPLPEAEPERSEMAKDKIRAAELPGTPLAPEDLAAIPDFASIPKERWLRFPGTIEQLIGCDWWDSGRPLGPCLSIRVSKLWLS